MLTNFLQAPCDSSDGYYFVACPVSCLLKFIRPPAIFQFIVSLFVGPSVQCHAAWTNPHIFKKVFKLQPAVTNPHSFRSIIFVALPFWICASLNHVNPSPVGGRSPHSVSSKPICGNLFVEFRSGVWFDFVRHNITVVIASVGRLAETVARCALYKAVYRGIQA